MGGRLQRQKPWPVSIGRKREKSDTEWHSLLATAVKNPGVWYRVLPDYDTPGAAASCAYDIASGRNKSIPAGDWEAASRTSDSGMGVLFVKYEGPSE